MERYILKYLYDQSNNPKEKRFLDYFKMQLDYRLYNFGMHQASDFEGQQRKHIEEMQMDKGMNLILHPKRLMRKLRECIFGMSKPKDIQSKPVDHIEKSVSHYQVLSLAPLTKAATEELNRNNIAVYHYGKTIFEGEVKYESKSLKELGAFVESLKYADFNQLLTNENYGTLDSIFQRAVEEFRAQAFDALLIWTGETLENKFIIDVFKELGRPSITLLHGLPGIYTKATESRADYLMVWGEEIRKNFINVGYDPKRVCVAGNYKYISSEKETTQKNSTEDVLVLTSAPFATHQHEWQWKKFSSQDRELLITYLYSIENVLKKNGITHVRLRPHPSVSKKWLAKFVDLSFYAIDNEDFKTSLTKATLCVGQLSSTVLEAMQYGVPYIVYEPSEDGVHGLVGGVIVPPFDGSSKYLKVANTEEQLNKMIKEKYVPDMRLLDEYMVPFDGAVIRNEIKDWKSKIKK